VSEPSVTLATRILHEAGRTVRRVARFRLRPDGGAAVESGETAFRIGSREGNDLVLPDTTVSRIHAEIVATAAGFLLRDLGSTNGTWVDDWRVGEIYLRPGARLRFGRAQVVFDLVGDESEVEISSRDRFGPVLGRSAAMREVFAVLERAAKSDATIVLEGESGTGKELAAEAIHRMSPRADRAFAVFDCASVPATLVESELLGHEKGSFTGATSRRIGRFEEADGGTLFLDEVGELPLDLQPKLLRALEKRELRRVGGSETIGVDVRIVAATNRDLAREVNRGAFREDLYYRLAVVRVKLPPLRERLEDLPLLVEHFVTQLLASDPARAQRALDGIGESTWKELRAHPWPGNVRELRNFVERTLALSGPKDAFGAGALAAPVAGPTPLASPAPSGGVDLGRSFLELKQETLARFEEAYLKGILAAHEGNYSRAAAAAGLDRMYFKRLLKKYGG
jgi:two-component system, NtrC family, response regulator GlrR